MGGSAGDISGSPRAPSTITSEQDRQRDSSMSSTSPHMGTHTTFGTITQVHPEKPLLVKAYDMDGYPIADGEWIRLLHSSKEIAERWGLVSIGMRVQVTLTGLTGSDASAVIAGDVDEPHTSTEVAKGLYAIFQG